MRMRAWRREAGKTLDQCARKLGLSGANPARTLQRYEVGAQWPDADVIVAIEKLTGGAVTAQDHHEQRLEWLRERGRLDHESGAARAGAAA